jgi:hypothetical protein
LKKEIEHKIYTAPVKIRRKVNGKWVHERARHSHRTFDQTIHVLHTEGPARRYLPLASHPVAPTFPQFDAYVHKLLTLGVKEPSDVAKRKFHPHRPKPAGNTSKNRARRHSQDLVLGAKTPGNQPPNPPILINAAQVRLEQALKPSMNVRTLRSITGWRSHKRNGDSVAQHRRKARKCSQRMKHKRRKA